MAVKGATAGAKAIARRNIESLRTQIRYLRSDNSCGEYNAAIRRYGNNIAKWRETLCARTISVEEFGTSFREC